MLVGFHHGRCNTCDQRYIPNNMLPNEITDNDYDAEMDIIDNFYKTQPGFVYTIESLKGAWNKVNRKYSRLYKSTNSSLKKFRVDFAHVAGFLKDKSRQKVKEILSSTEYVEYKRDSLSYAVKLRKFLNDWGVSPYNLGAYLRRNGSHPVFLYSGYRLRSFKNKLLRKFRFRI